MLSSVEDMEGRKLYTAYNYNPEKIIEETRNYLEARQYEAYDHVSALCNPVLSKNPFSSNFLIYFLNQEPIPFSFLFFLKVTLIFLISTGKSLLFECTMILICGKLKKYPSESRVALMSFFNFHRKRDSIFDMNYLSHLQGELINKGVSYLYVPKFFNLPRNPINAKHEIEDVKRQNKDFISPYELIPRWQILSLFCLSMGHFYQAIKTLRPFSRDLKDQCYNRALLESLQKSEVYKFVHYLSTKELLKKSSVEKIVLWYENQVIDKCIIKAARSAKRLEIFGCQFFLITPQEQNLFPSLYEIEHNLLPDRIFINQEPPAKCSISSKYILGNSPRYKYFRNYDFNNHPCGEEGTYTVFLALYKERNRQTYEILLRSFLHDKKLFIKKHPANTAEVFPLSKGWEETDRAQEELLNRSELIIATETGVIYEAMAMERQVIIISSNEMISHLIPPIEYCGKLWMLARTPTELEEAINQLRVFRENNLMELKQLSTRLRETYFITNDKMLSEILELA